MSKSTPPAGEDAMAEMLCFSIYSAHHAFNRLYKPLLQQLGLTYPQYLVMMTLWAADDQTVGALGDQVDLASSTLTPLLKRLQASGLVKRARSTADERQVRISLTPAGKALEDRARIIPRCIMEASGFTQEDVRRMISQISALGETLRRAANQTATQVIA